MGWTHDYRDVSRNRRSTSAANGAAPPAVLPVEDSRLGIPLILRRRARWMSARLRHVRD